MLFGAALWTAGGVVLYPGRDEAAGSMHVASRTGAGVGVAAVIFVTSKQKGGGHETTPTKLTRFGTNPIPWL